MIMITEAMWVTVAFVVLVSLLFKPVKNAFLGIVDRYIIDTRSTLKEAEDLKLDAKKKLAEAEGHLENSKRVSESLLKRSEEEANAIIQDAKTFAKSEAEKQVKVIISNFEARKEQMFAEIKEQAVDKAIINIAERFDESMTEEDENALFEFGITKFNKTIH